MCERCEAALAALDVDVAALELDQVAHGLDVAAGHIPAWAARPLFPHERRARYNPARSDESTTRHAASIVAAADEHRTFVANAIATVLADAATPAQVAATARRIADPARPIVTDVAGYRHELDDLTAIVAAELRLAFADGTAAAAAEAAAQGRTVTVTGTPTVAEARLLDDRAKAAAQLVTSTVTGAIAEATTRLPLLTAPPATSIAALVDLARTAGAKRLVTYGARIPVQQAHAAGRIHAIRAIAGPAAQLADPTPAPPLTPDDIVLEPTPTVDLFYASELLDRNTCDPCSLVDGVTYSSLDEALADYPAGTYVGCEGGDGCRGTIVAVWDSEEAATVQDVAPVPRPEPPAPPAPPEPPPGPPETPPPAPPAPAAPTAAQVREEALAELAAATGYTLEELRTAAAQVDDLRAAMRAEAAATQDAARAWLGGGPSPLTGRPGPGVQQLTKPPRAVRRVDPVTGRIRVTRPGAGGEWDWLEQVDPKELARLQKRGWFADVGQSPDQLAQHLAAVDPTIADGIAGVDQAAEQWRRHTSLVDASGSVARGRPFGTGHLVGYDDIAPNLAAEGWDVRLLAEATPDALSPDAVLHVAGKVAADDVDYAWRELTDAFRTRTGAGDYRAIEGPAPWRMSTDAYRGELLDVEASIRDVVDAGGIVPEPLARRWNELVPIDDVDLDGNLFSPDELHARTVDLANRAKIDGAVPLKDLNAVPPAGRFDVIAPDPEAAARAAQQAADAARAAAEAEARAAAAEAERVAAEQRALAEAEARRAEEAARAAREAADAEARRTAEVAAAQQAAAEAEAAARSAMQTSASYRPPRDVVTFDDNVPDRLRGLLDELGQFTGAADDGRTSTAIHYKKAPKTQGKGGHFSPSAPQVPKPRRIRGQDPSVYRERYDAWRTAPRIPEILVYDGSYALDATNALLHEFGHRVDSLDATRFFSSSPAISRHVTARITEAYGRTVAYELPELTEAEEAMAQFLTAARQTDAMTTFYGEKGVDRPYLRDPIEMWARAYAQWSATRIGGEAAAGLERTLGVSETLGWRPDEFAILSPLLEKVLRARGLLA